MLVATPVFAPQTRTESYGDPVGVSAVNESEELRAETVHLDIKGETQGELPEVEDEVIVGVAPTVVEMNKAELIDSIAQKPSEMNNGELVDSIARSPPMMKVRASVKRAEYADANHDKWIDVLSTSVHTNEELELFVTATFLTHTQIEEVEINENAIVMTYVKTAKLFGFVPATYTAIATVDQSDTEGFSHVKVKFPWGLVFASDDSAEFEDELASIGDDAQLANIDLQNRLAQQQQTLQTMSNVAK